MVDYQAERPVTRVCVVHYFGATAKSQSVVASLVADQRDSGATVELVDISRWTTISQALPPRLIVRLLGHDVYPSAFATEMAALGVTVTQPQLLARAPSEVRPEHRAEVETAIESELLTYFRVDSLPGTRAVKALRKQLRRAAVKSYWALDGLWSENPPDSVFIPNGRTSRQKAARKVAEHHGIPITLYENGRARPNSYYAGATQPHDRVASQAELPRVIKGMPHKQIEALAEGWLALRMSPTGGTNSFSGLWNEGLSAQAGEKKTAVFFASSFDEFLAFGPMWTIDSWSHQFEAFDLVMSILEKSGIQLVLRLHPNLGTKSRRYFLREVNDMEQLATRHPGLKIYWHNDSVNSYDLVKSADYVIVERSTIGLEASIMGKPVWVTQASQWDLTADIRQVLRAPEITEDLMAPWAVDSYRAKQFAAYWMVQERPLRYSWESWSSWNPERAPLALKIALLGVKNPTRHKLQLIRLEWAKWRNSSFRAP